MVDIKDLQEGFYLIDKRIRSPIIQLGYVCRVDENWVSYVPGGGVDLEQFQQTIGTRSGQLDPIFLEGPINPKDCLKKINSNLEKFINLKSKQLAESESSAEQEQIIVDGDLIHPSTTRD